MDEIATGTRKAPRKHLLTPEALRNAPATTHREGNGVRIHGIYFVAVSLAALVLVIVAIVVAAPMM